MELRNYMGGLLNVKRLTPTAILPTRNHPSDAGLDLYADEDIEIIPGNIAKVHTNIAIELPPMTVGRIVDRSSLGSSGIHTVAGVIDSNYRGGVIVCLANFTEFVYFIMRGNKVAQLLVIPVLLPVVQDVEELNTTDRGISGFGSSGR